MAHKIQISLERLSTLVAAVCLFVGIIALAPQAQADHHMTLYASGDSDMVYEDDLGKITGYATDVFACSMKKLGHTFETRRAPITRSHIVLNQKTHTLWFPASIDGSKERLERLVGPIGTIDIIWLTKKDYNIEVGSPEFQKHARVTAYTGSSMERWLIKEDYNFIKGSADRNRVFNMIMSDQVDAVLAVDFRNTLPKEMQRLAREKLKATPYRSVPVGFRVSAYLAQSLPNFTSNFRRVLDSCR